MTVSYTENVATCRGIGNFAKLLFRWRGSIYKVLLMEVIIFIVCFYIINFFYRFYLVHTCNKKRFFLDLVRYCDAYGQSIPISFVLGFYVEQVVSRWWTRFLELPWPDATALTITCIVDGTDDRGRILRRTMLRYINLAFVLGLSHMAPGVKLRFPTLDHLMEAGFLLEPERDQLIEMDKKMNHLYPKFWVPCVWASLLAKEARKEGRIKDDISLMNVVSIINNFRKSCQNMIDYDWVNVPLVYTQVVTLAVHLYFLAALMGRQFIIVGKSREAVDIYIPFFVFFEFFFYYGWLKVAECLINPFGSDDDDFETHWLIDRNFQVSYVIVDEMHHEHPSLLKDQYWDEVCKELPYTEAAAKYKKNEGQMGSAVADDIKKEEVQEAKKEKSVTLITAKDKEGATDVVEGRGKEDSKDKDANRKGSGQYDRKGSSEHLKEQRKVRGDSSKTGISGESSLLGTQSLMEQEDVQYVPEDDVAEGTKNTGKKSK